MKRDLSEWHPHTLSYVTEDNPIRDDGLPLNLCAGIIRRRGETREEAMARPVTAFNVLFWGECGKGTIEEYRIHTMPPGDMRQRCAEIEADMEPKRFPLFVWPVAGLHMGFFIGVILGFIYGNAGPDQVRELLFSVYVVLSWTVLPALAAYALFKIWGKFARRGV